MPALDGWRGRSVFLTGHTGFKGGWMSALLASVGARVTGYALAPATSPSLFEVAGIGGQTASTIADIRDLARLRKVMGEAEPEVVFHLAAQALVRPAYADPIGTFETNVMGTANVLEAVRAVASVKAVIVVTSDKVYQNNEWPWGYRETDALGGREPYGVSKACAELVAESYRYSYLGPRGCRVATARAGNVIGGGDWSEDRLVPDAVRAFSSGNPLVLRNPDAVRPWQHVLESLSGYVLLAEALLAGRDVGQSPSFNFGPAASDTASVRDVVDRLAELWGAERGWRQDNAFKPYEAHLLQVDSAKAHQVLGWRPGWRLDDALRETVAWYRANHEGRDMAEVTRKQIARYLAGRGDR